MAALQLSAYEQDWAPIVEVARAIMAGRAPNPVEVGGVDGASLIFSMDDLFEGLLRRRLEHAATAVGLHLIRGVRAPRLLRDVDSGRQSLPIRPDFLFSRAGTNCLVGDAKWKVVERGRRETALDRSDIYQMTAYMVRNSLHRSVLFFPGQAGKTSLRRFDILPGTGRLCVATVDTAGLVDPSVSGRAGATAWLSEVLSAAEADKAAGGSTVGG